MVFTLKTVSWLSLLAIISGAQAQQPTTDYTFVNNCPTAIKLYRHNAFSTDLAKGANVTRQESLATGYFYTDANGGGGSQTDPSTKFATYWAENDPKYYYYIVKNTTSFNTGMRIEPSHPEVDGFCQSVTCDAADCETAFPRRTVFTDLGPISPTPPTEPPSPPLYSCPFEGVTYVVTFCPSGTFPASA
ncbi:hypothetical protein CPB83DRAFT_833904 [Crepidotus variabilis]|uniref:Osmotin, thaumatin-like protein n=1 Tax=Crepidotus variabilis TaxID=179855 RepID=A0A9P6JSU4_9AGAR|nr:hypothetical protein CPB83DRAFT_833904 [Crepidotus variabilis]